MPSCWFVETKSDVWFSFIAIGTHLQIKIIGGKAAGKIKNISFALYSGNCDTLKPIPNVCDATSGLDSIRGYSKDLKIGQRYFLRIGSHKNYQGTFKLCVNNFTPFVTANDYADAVKLCDKSDRLDIVKGGPGKDDQLIWYSSCVQKETNTSWYRWKCKQSGTLTVDILPFKNSVDLDAVFFEVNDTIPVTVPPKGDRKIIRCTATDCPPLGAIGLNLTETDTVEGAGCITTPPANSYLKYINMLAGKSYALMIENATDSSGYSIHFGGTGTFLASEAVITSSATDICKGNTVQYDALLSTNYKSFKWIFNHGAPSTASGKGPIIVRYDSSGTYPVYLTLDSVCQSASSNDTAQIIVNPAPVINTTSVVITNTVNSDNKGSITGIVVQGKPVITYEWHKLPTTQIATTLDLIDVGAGVYYLVVTGGDGCKDTVGNYEIKNDISTAVIEKYIVYDLSVAPNPTSGQVNLDFRTSRASDIKIEIQNIIGQTIAKEWLKNPGKIIHHEIDLSAQNGGIYFVKITQDNYTTVKRIIRQ